jgi:malate synthase
MNYEPRLNTAPAGFDPRRDLPAGFWDFYLPLHRRYTPWQQELLAKRKEQLVAAHQGKLPGYLPPSAITTEDWRIALPPWILDQRNQMTGPVDDEELSVKMLNSGAPGVMLDLEDSMANTWDNLMRGQQNALAALYGELSFCCKNEAPVYIKPSPTVIFIRARGLHLSQAGVAPGGELTSASLFDAALLTFRVDRAKLKHNLSFYIPKSESADEAKWWAALFNDLAAAKGWEPDAIKAMALVESFPMAYQFEEFLYYLRDHILGLNLGRWDYMASLIHFNFYDPDWVLPDRNTIPHNVPFFQAVRTLIPQLCHKHGALAIGGMTALYPSRVDAELNERALKVLAEDKKNEAACGMDGAWTGHPDQNQIALDQFPIPNQLDRWDRDHPRYPDLRPAPVGVGKRTVDGTRAAVRTTILYRYGYLSGKGASLINGYMEDLATDRIYRLMIAQRIAHRDHVVIADEHGQAVSHTPEFVSRLYDEELAKLLAALPADADEATRQRYRQAREWSEAMIVNGWFDPV